MPKVRLRKRGKRGGRRGSATANAPKGERRTRIYDTKGNLILVGTVAEWRENVRERKAQAAKEELKHKRRQPPARVKRRKPLLKVKASS